MIDDDIETLGHETVSFLSLFDVLEHLLEPKSFLDQAFNSLVPNGAILVGVPNFNALDRYVIGVNAKALIFPEHVNQFTKKA
jgi:2-polyprenyl-3-methyl-5-hydroxy-6-metoxy-1,4-benzoquinol methylase